MRQQAGGRRGQPLVVLAVLLAGWIAFRATMWQAPVQDAAQAPLLAASTRAGVSVRSEPVPAFLPLTAALPVALPTAIRLKREAAANRPEPRFLFDLAPSPAVPLSLDPPPPFLQPLPPSFAAGHSLILMAGLARLELPPALAQHFARHSAPGLRAAPAHPPVVAAARAAQSRWSRDGWLLLRRDTTTPVTSGRGSYGRSQLGAVLRYRLAPASGHHPAAYLRASGALAGARENEVALGLAARPVPRLPLAVAAELRVAHAPGRTSLRPVAYAVSELPPMQLPGGFVAEAWLQAGYAGGDFATGFVDGQARIERRMAVLGDAELSAGGGVWGGAQKGASRVDIGPGASLKLTVGKTASRVSLDWRFRIAGEAEPSSGPALTISAGF